MAGDEDRPAVLVSHQFPGRAPVRVTCLRFQIPGPARTDTITLVSELLPRQGLTAVRRVPDLFGSQLQLGANFKSVYMRLDRVGQSCMASVKNSGGACRSWARNRTACSTPMALPLIAVNFGMMSAGAGWSGSAARYAACASSEATPRRSGSPVTSTPWVAPKPASP